MQNNRKVKIKIVSCRDSMLWYNARVGEEFYVFATEWDHLRHFRYLWVRTGDAWNTSNWVYENDAEYVNN